MDDVSKLGPLWVAETIRMVQSHRDSLANNMARLKQDGDFAKQHQMVIDVCDRMLAAAKGGAL